MAGQRAAARIPSRTRGLPLLWLATMLLTRPARSESLSPSGTEFTLSPGPVPAVLDRRHRVAYETFVAAPRTVVAFDDAYERWLASSRRSPKVLRFTLESTLLIALGSAYYWVDPLANSADWDYPTFGQKLSFESVRFDNNLFATNHILHPLAGAANYGLARVNGLTPAGALVSTIAFSVVWEFALEYREQVSVNDMLFTPFGGAALGEFLYQLGEYLNSAPGGGGLAQRAAAATLGLPQRLHDALDGVEASREPPLDALGFSYAYWHRFGLAYEGTLASGDRGPSDHLHGFRVDARLAAMPGFLRPGRFQRGFQQGNFVEIRARAGWGGSGTSEVDIWSFADLAGRYAQDFAISESGGRSGSASLLGLSTAFRFNQRELLERHDRFAVVHLLGPHAAAWVGSDGLLASCDASFHGDFAGVHPAALRDWQELTPNPAVKSILAKERYVYTFGFSSRLRARLALRSMEFSAFVSHGQYESVEGIDRREELLTRDPHTSDTILEYGASAELSLPHVPISLGFGVEVLRRTGSMGGVHSAFEERRVRVTPGLRF